MIPAIAIAHVQGVEMTSRMVRIVGSSKDSPAREFGSDGCDDAALGENATPRESGGVGSYL
mgnify:CR=1 FL=1